VNITLVSVARENVGQGVQASAIYTFCIDEGFAKTRAEVMLIDGGFAVIDKRGKDSKHAARLALERALERAIVSGRDPLQSPIFLRVPYQHAEYFSRFGEFHKTFPSA
jgi:hypothetical protein